MPRKAEKKPGITGQRIASLRRRAELTQQELADQMNARGIAISAGLIKLMEAGRASVTDQTMEKYMDFFQCSREYLTGEDASPYTGFLRILNSETVKEELTFQAGLAALIHRSIPPERIIAMELQGKLDSGDLHRRAYEHMIRFVEAELRKAEKPDAKLVPGGAEVVRNVEELQHALDHFRGGSVSNAFKQFEKIQVATERAEEDHQE